MRLSKVEIAKRQLDVASEIFFSGGDYLAVITLAGAAEEILGNLLKRQGMKNMLDRLVELDKELTGGRDFEVIRKEVNGARNAIKHARDATEDEIVIEHGEAIAMLGRSVVNYVKLAREATPAMVRVYEHLIQLHPDVVR
jgi:hypothetical protein